MSARIFVSYSIEDEELGSQLVALSRALIDGIEVDSSTAPETLPLTRDDGAQGLDQRLRLADAVITVCAAREALPPSVAFELGAAFALGRPLFCVGSEGPSAFERVLPEGRAQVVSLAPEALLELFAAVATRVGLRSEVRGAARAVLGEMFPEFRGLDRESSERPVQASSSDSSSTQQIWPVGAETDAASPAASAQQPPSRLLPSCAASLEAGRAIADCMWSQGEGGEGADELDVPFGAFLASLGGNWSMLRELGDVELWIEAADNLLGSLPAHERYVHRWYEIGYQLAMLACLARAELEGDSRDASQQDEAWQTAWASLQRAAHDAGVATDALAELHAMLENLRGPSRERDYANLGLSQQRVRALANAHDAGGVSASA